MGTWGGNLKQMARKYGRVAVGVHLTVSGLCFSGCYLAVLSSVDVEGMLEKVGLGSWLPHQAHEPPPAPSTLPSPSTSLPSSQHERKGEAAHSHHPFSQDHPGGTPPPAQHGGWSLPGGRDQAGNVTTGPMGDGAPTVYQGETGGGGGVSGGQEGGGNWSLVKGGGAFAIAWICNKALFPVRVPITIGLTPPIHRFLVSKGFRV